MSAQRDGVGQAGPRYQLIQNPDLGFGADRVGLVVEAEGAVRLRLGPLSGLREPASGARLVLAMAREDAPDWLAALATLQPVNASPFTDLIASLADNLADHAPALDRDDAAVAVESLLLLAAGTVDAVDPLASPGGSDDPDLNAAARLIEARLLDQDLDVALLMQELGLSRSSLYRAFQPVGGVNAWIRRRRLENARDMLARRTGGRPTVGEVAQSHGFASESHFSRSFSKAFGHPPGARRAGPSSGGA